GNHCSRQVRGRTVYRCNQLLVLQEVSGEVRDDEMSRDDNGSEGFSSHFTAINHTPARQTGGGLAGVTPGQSVPATPSRHALRRVDMPDVEVAFHYRVRGDDGEESERSVVGKLVAEAWGGVQRLRPLVMHPERVGDRNGPHQTGLLAQAEGEVREEKCKRCAVGMGPIFGECVVNPIWGTACMACPARGGSGRCSLRDKNEKKSRSGRCKPELPRKKSTLETEFVATLDEVEGNELVKLCEWAKGGGVKKWRQAVEEAKKVVRAVEAGLAFVQTDKADLRLRG
ncbi:hypothetical protein KEM55_001147, partial [Ascosphaera atra]